MFKRLGAFALTILLLVLFCVPASAAQIGPAATYDDLLLLAADASDGDTLLVCGMLTASADQPLTTEGSLHVVGDGDGAGITGLSLRDASVVFSGLSLHGGVRVEGESHIQLTRGVSVEGPAGRSAIEFSGSGTLLLDPGSSVAAGSDASGVSVRHTGGDLYISLDGRITGGAGETGGAAAMIDPLSASGALMITGTLTGGDGKSFGGNALNLHNLSGNAFITVEGKLTGGAGSIGGSGIQLITADGSVTAGIGGQITGGRGESYGGDAMMLMNVGGSSSVSLSGSLTGGDSSGTNSTPGQSLKLLGKSTALHTYVGDCILQDGRQVLSAITITPLPAITSSVDDAQTLSTPEPTPVPTIVPTGEPTCVPSVEPSITPTAEPTIVPTAEPTATPTVVPTVEPTEAPTSEPTAALTAQPTLEPPLEPSVQTPGEAA